MSAFVWSRKYLRYLQNIKIKYALKKINPGGRVVLLNYTCSGFGILNSSHQRKCKEGWNFIKKSTIILKRLEQQLWVTCSVLFIFVIPYFRLETSLRKGSQIFARVKQTRYFFTSACNTIRTTKWLGSSVVIVSLLSSFQIFCIIWYLSYTYS